MMNLLNRAWLFAKQKHNGQLDDDNLPYFGHVVQVANLLKLVTEDEDVIAAGYLHDTLEDTDTTYGQLRRAFSERIADLVMEMTHEGKPDHIGYYLPRLHSKEGILIKFADRLSNLSRMESWAIPRQNQYLSKSKFWRTEP